MNTKEAIMAFSQSEKIKSGLIWLSHALEIQGSLPSQETQGAEKIVNAFAGMVFQEVQLAKAVAGDSIPTRHSKAAVVLS